VVISCVHEMTLIDDRDWWIFDSEHLGGAFKTIPRALAGGYHVCPCMISVRHFVRT
jgi:hypothetical protein